MAQPDALVEVRWVRARWTTPRSMKVVRPRMGLFSVGVKTWAIARVRDNDDDPSSLTFKLEDTSYYSN